MKRLTALLAGFTMLVALIALPTERVAAHVETSGPIILPQTGSGDVVRLPGQAVLAVAGGDDSPVVFVDLSDRRVTVVPGTIGVRTLDLDDDGARLHGVSRTPDEIVEIDVSTVQVARRWPVPDACLLSDTVLRGGFLWVAQGCGDSRLRRLDPTTGVVTPAAPDLEAQSLVGEPGTSRFYTFSDGTSPVLGHQDASPTGLVELDRWERDLSSMLTGDIHLSEDGGTLFVPNRDGFGGPDDTWAWSTTPLLFSETWDVRLHPFWADADHIGVELPQQGVPALLTRDGQTLVNSFLPDDVAGMSTSDVRRVGDDLVLTGFAGGEKRVYVVADPLVEEPQLTIDVPWGSTGVNTPTPLTGTASSGGRPLASQELQLIEVSPTSRVLATVVTNEAGEWTHEWTPDAVGAHVLEIRYRGARDSVDRVRVAVKEIYERLDLSGPSVVVGGDDIVMTATVTRNGQPLPGITVDLERQDWAEPSYFEFEELGAVPTDESGVATFTTPPGPVDGYWYYAEALLPNDEYGRFRTDGHRVEVTRTPTTLVIEPEVTTAAPGDPVPVHISLTTDGGQPVAGVPVLVEVHSSSGYRTATVTTGADGTATYVDTWSQEGWTYPRAQFRGTLVLDDAWGSHPGLERKRIATTVVVDGSTTGEVGVPVEIEGQVTGVDGPVELTITDGHGAESTVATHASGAWTATFTPTDPGSNSWQIAFAGTTRLAPSSARHWVQTPRLATAIEVESVKAQVDRYLEVTGRIAGISTQSALQFRFDDTMVGTRYTDSTFSARLTDAGPLRHAGPATLVISYAGDARHEPARVEIAVDVEKAPSVLELTEGPFVDPGDSFDVSGTVVPAVTGQVTFSVVDPAGDVAPVTVDASDGHFVLPLTVPESTTSTPEWDVTFPGTDDYAAVTTTYQAQLRADQQIKLAVNPARPRVGDTVDVRLEPPAGVARVTVHDRFGTQLHSWEGTVDAYGRLLHKRIHTAWRVTVTLRGDDQHREATREILVRPSPHLDNSLRGGEYSRSTAPYYVYDRGEVPRLLSRAVPRDLRGCLTRIVQRRTTSGWRTIDRTCVRYSGELAHSRIRGVGRPGVRYRLRTTFEGNRWYRPGRSGFTYFRFRA